MNGADVPRTETRCARAFLLIDFGSTNTKVTAVDTAIGAVIGTATSFTTVETDVGDGLNEALELLREKCGELIIERRFACSSAAGGLKMIVCGLVPALTAEAARLASLGAGAKVVRVFAYQLTDEDIDEIDEIKPDILLLTGGVDGGNSECIIHNAEMLARARADFPIIIAGNRSASAKCEKLLESRSGVKRCANVMPVLGKLNIEPVQAEIRELFLQRIIQAKGLSHESGLVSGILMPTPSAVKRAVELLSRGTKTQRGFGELAAVDLGGATTDVYSVADGMPENPATMLKGLEEPRSKRTVEGDIGMRYSAPGVLEAAGAPRLARLSGIDEELIAKNVAALHENPAALPESEAEHALDFALAASAVQTAMTRHAGVLDEMFTVAGPVFVQTGKDLRSVRSLILTGGAVIHNARAGEIGAFACYSASEPMSLRPRDAEIYVDRSYILSAAGLLAEEYPEISLSIMKKELVKYGSSK